MGQAESFLAQPVTSANLRREGTAHFKVGVAEVAGYRASMEDAHCVRLSPAGGLFGVFDGHGADTCSDWLAKRLPAAFLQTNPEFAILPEAEVVRLCLDLDAEYLEERYVPPGGSTACVMAASLPMDSQASFRCQVQVLNVGDSPCKCMSPRLLVGRAGEVLFRTVDHKPEDEAEQARILAAEGTVEGGRLDGKLALSRAFGDPDFKEDPCRSAAQQKLIAVPDVAQLEVLAGDFAVVACDGLYEPGITPEEVCQLAGELLGHEKDTALVAAALCKYALEKGSHDNVTVMVVQFGVVEYVAQFGPRGFIPGPFNGFTNDTFHDVYGQAARAAGKRTAEAYELRYDLLRQHGTGAATSLRYVLGAGPEAEELAAYGPGPPPDLVGAARTEWFRAHLTAKCREAEE